MTGVRELIRFTFGPQELRALRRGAICGAVVLAAWRSFCVFGGAGWVTGLGRGSIFAWFGFTAGLLAGLMDTKES
jgi:hypothetical protein